MDILFINEITTPGRYDFAKEFGRRYPGLNVLTVNIDLDPDSALKEIRGRLEWRNVEAVVSVGTGAMFARQLRGVTKILIDPKPCVSFDLEKMLGEEILIPGDGLYSTRKETVTREIINKYVRMEIKLVEESDQENPNETFSVRPNTSLGRELTLHHPYPLMCRLFDCQEYGKPNEEEIKEQMLESIFEVCSFSGRGIVFNEVDTTHTFKLFGCEIHGVQALIDAAEKSVRRFKEIDERVPKKRIEGLHVVEFWVPYPTFDSYDECDNRYYYNFLVRDSEITDDEIMTFAEGRSSGNYCHVNIEMSPLLVPAVYWRGEGRTMTVATFSPLDKP